MPVFLEPKPEERARFLHCLHDITHGSVKKQVYVEQVTKALHLDEAEAEAILKELVAEELVRLRLQCILSITEGGLYEIRFAQEAAEELAAAKPAPPKPAPAAPKHLEHNSVSHTLLGAGSFPEDTVALQPEAAPPVETQHEHDDLELKLICEAIGLDPRELNGAPASNGNHAGVAPNEPQHPFHAEPLKFDPGELAGLLASLKLRLLKLRLSIDDLGEAEAEIATATAQLHSPRPKQPIIVGSLTTLLGILDGPGAASMTIDLQVSLTEIRFFLTRLQV
jgi:hypothetical protein